MSLEERIAYWVDAGTTRYLDMYAFQEKLVTARKDNHIPDVILATQHFPVVNFGSDKPNNQFSETFLKSVEQKYGTRSPRSIIEELRTKGIGYAKTSRGGGATVLAPGQLVYYPVVKHAEVTGKPLEMKNYKSRVYAVMFNALKDLGVNKINVGSQDAYESRRDRRDVWVQRDNISLKMGSKGLKFSQDIAHQGFVLYIDRAGLEHFELVKPCGYEPSEVRATSVEEELGRSIDHAQVHEVVRNQITRQFDYNKIEEVSIEKLLEMVRGVKIICQK